MNEAFLKSNYAQDVTGCVILISNKIEISKSKTVTYKIISCEMMFQQFYFHRKKFFVMLNDVYKMEKYHFNISSILTPTIYEGESVQMGTCVTTPYFR